LGPPTLVLAQNGSQSVLTFPTLPGQIYQLLSTTNLLNPNWAVLGGPVVGTGAPVRRTNTLSAPLSFFELQITP